ncbi:ester cyclase [Pseudomonas kurunegalensis]|uniref:ester cyclase n=1 Tax=Pseudomonas kurunegalensis TaxID=485880 RepID=UPI0025705142|nr:ester cyclase [Pseudomonas kurunegalensis]WJD60712.1 ester cyclase [Pseudomonas kurunegalensis]
MSTIDNVARNKENLRALLQDAMPNGRFDQMEALVSPDCITRRAGFASLFVARGDAIPEKGNFLNWLKAGWKPLTDALRFEPVVVSDIVGEGNKAMIHFTMTVTHVGEFVGMPATGKKISWEEIGIARFDDDGKMDELWFMCEELKMALELGLKLQE